MPHTHYPANDMEAICHPAHRRSTWNYESESLYRDPKIASIPSWARQRNLWSPVIINNPLECKWLALGPVGSFPLWNVNTLGERDSSLFGYLWEFNYPLASKANFPTQVPLKVYSESSSCAETRNHSIPDRLFPNLKFSFQSSISMKVKWISKSSPFICSSDCSSTKENKSRKEDSMGSRNTFKRMIFISFKCISKVWEYP